MRIPQVMDEQCEKVLFHAASPVLVLFEVAGNVISRMMREVAEDLSDQFDDRIIFIRISADENPAVAEKLAYISEVDSEPRIVVFKRTKPIGVIRPHMGLDDVLGIIERAITSV